MWARWSIALCLSRWPSGSVMPRSLCITPLLLHMLSAKPPRLSNVLEEAAFQSLNGSISTLVCVGQDGQRTWADIPGKSAHLVPSASRKRTSAPCDRPDNRAARPQNAALHPGNVRKLSEH